MRKYQGGPLHPVPPVPDLPRAIGESARRLPDKTAVLEPAEPGSFRSVTYRQLWNNVEWMARGLLTRNPKPVVAVAGDNSIQWYTTYLAAIRAGGVIVPIDRELPPADMRTILHYSGANMVVHDPRFIEVFSGIKGVENYPMNMGGMNAPRHVSDLLRAGRDGAAELPDTWDVNAPAAICYTSGTTGMAKGVVLSQENLVSDLRQVISLLTIYEEDVFLSILPVHHSYECTCGFLLPLVMGNTIAIAHGLRYVAEDLAATGATVVIGVPLLWEKMYGRIMDGIRNAPGGAVKYRAGTVLSGIGEFFGAKKLRKKLFSRVHERFGGALRLFVSGGAGIDPEVIRGFQRLGFTILEGYGLTETAPIVTVNRDRACRPGSVGVVLPECEVRIEDPDEKGIGEILVKGPNVMLGYHGNPGATAEVLSPDGWFRTGDLGRMDRDGFLYITGRKKNVIIAKNGKNVFPEELETVLNRNAHVSESMVFGRKTGSKGEEIWAVVVPDRDLLIQEAEREGRKITTEDEVDSVRRAIRRFNEDSPQFMRIAGFIISEEDLPKTTTRKVKRNEALKAVGFAPSSVHRP